LTAAFPDSLPEHSHDGFLGGRLQLRQPLGRAHRAGLDAILVAAAVPESAEGLLVDLGAGVGVAGLAAALRAPAIRVALAERDPLHCRFARTNAADAPALAWRTMIAEVDVTDRAARLAAGLSAGSAAFVVMNPPFHPAAASRASPDAGRAAAHVLPKDALDGWVRAAADLLAPGGTLAVIFRADGLGALLAAFARRFGAIDLLPVHPRADAPATRVVARARLGSRGPLRLVPPLVLHDGRGSGYLPLADAVLRGAALPFPPR